MSRRPIVIAGAGPAGLSAALFLTDRDVPVLMLERGEEVYDDPRAATFHPPTLEMLAPSGVTEQLHRQGLVVRKWQTWDRTHGLIAEFDLGVLSGETAFPYRLQCEQHKLCGILIEVLSRRPNFELRFGEGVEDVVQHADGVTVKTNHCLLEADYVIGADGGRSVVRKSQDIDFEGFTYPERFLVITNTYDFEAEGYALSCYVADPEEWCALFKIPGDGPPGLWRVVFPTDPDDDEATLTAHVAARKRLDRFLPRAKPYEIVHTNLYTVHQRVAGAFRRGRVMLVGDAAHINNPLGGIGMNFGIQDANNLADKLAAVVHGQARPEALDLYDRQRRSVAVQFLQAMTIENKKALEEKDPMVAAARRQALKQVASDPTLARAHLMRTAMIDGLRAAAAIT